MNHAFRRDRRKKKKSHIVKSREVNRKFKIKLKLYFIIFISKITNKKSLLSIFNFLLMNFELILCYLIFFYFFINSFIRKNIKRLESK